MRRRDEELDPEQERAPEAPVAEPAQPVATKQRSPANLLALQRTAGNAAVGRMLGRLLTNNPADLTDATGTSTTTWQAPTIADAVNQRGQTHVGTPQTAGALASPIAVKPKATAASPLVKDTATAAELFDQEASHALPAGTVGPTMPQTPGFQVVTHQQGSDAAPIADPIGDNSLFIDPGPKPLDVHQAGIGDCYALASIIAITNRDPGKIRAMMAPDGSGGATVTLYKRLAHAPGFFGFLSGPTYEPEQVQVSSDLAFNRSAPGAPTRATRSGTADTRFGFQLRGAQLHAADTPKERRWWVDVRGGVLEVHREDIFQMARWAPLLEKAIARFSQNFGQYGHGQQIAGEGEKQGSSGLVNIDGGWSGHTLTMFYGKTAEVVAGGNGDEIGTSWSAGQGASPLLMANQAAFDRLLTLQGRGASHQTGATTAPIVTATTGVGESGKRLYAGRLQSAFPAAMAAADWATLSAGAQAKINAAFGWTTAWVGAGPDAPATTPPTPPAPNTKTWAFNLWQPACATAAADPEITNPARSEPIKALLDLLLIIKNMPGDTGGGTRSVYANHVYSVLSADIKSTGGGASDIHLKPPMIRAAFYNTIDVMGSTVTLMNPHHANAPEATAGAANTPDPATGLTGAQSGQFTIPLERFFRLYGSVMSNEFTIPLLMRVDSDEALLALRSEYLRAVDEGASEFIAEFTAGAFGLDHPTADISLAPPGAHTPPEIDVVLRSDGVSVLAGVPMQVAARRVTIEGLAFTDTLRPALKITAAAAISLTRVTVLGVEADPYQRAVVDLGASTPGVTLAIEHCTIADSNAPNGAALGLYVMDGAWFDTAVLRTTTIAGATSESVVMIEALRSLDCHDCLLARGDALVLIRMAWPGEHAELSSCTLAAGAGDLLEILNPAPVEVQPMRLTHGTRTSAHLEELPEAPVADDTVIHVPDLTDEVADAIAIARDRIRRADPRLTA